MRRAAHRPDAWLVMLVSASLLAWSVLALDGIGLVPPAFCSAGPLRGLPLSVSFDLALVFNAPAQLASGWALMVAAMMSPLIVAPLGHVRDRSFARRRPRAMVLFVAGYLAVWMVAGLVLQAAAFAAQWAAPASLCLGLAAAAALLWQVSPAKQWCLNRCHRLPHLSAFGAAADRDAFDYGLTNGASCAGSCWALMLLTLFAGHHHIPGMIAVTLFVCAERLESPAPLDWRWRGCGKVWRIVAARVRLRVPLTSYITEASLQRRVSDYGRVASTS